MPPEHGEWLEDLMERQPLSAGQVIETAADIAKQLAASHRRGMSYGVIDSRHIRISEGRASLADVEPASGAGPEDDVRDFRIWLRAQVQLLPETPDDWRRGALDEIVDRYLQPEDEPATQMRKAAMALSLLRVASRSMAVPEVVRVREYAPPPSRIKIPQKGKVLMLVRVVSPDESQTTYTSMQPERKLPLWVTAIVAVCFVLVVIYLLRAIL